MKNCCHTETFRLLALLASLCAAAPSIVAADPPALTLADVQTVMAQAVSRAAKVAPNSVVAVVDREGFVLGAWDVAGRLGSVGDPLVEGQLSVVGGAIREAGTASYLSSDENAFTSRTAEFIIQQNFPPGIDNQSPGPLVGVEFSNLPFSGRQPLQAARPRPQRRTAWSTRIGVCGEFPRHWHPEHPPERPVVERPSL